MSVGVVTADGLVHMPKVRRRVQETCGYRQTYDRYGPATVLGRRRQRVPTTAAAATVTGRCRTVLPTVSGRRSTVLCAAAETAVGAAAAVPVTTTATATPAIATIPATAAAAIVLLSTAATTTGILLPIAAAGSAVRRSVSAAVIAAAAATAAAVLSTETAVQACHTGERDAGRRTAATGGERTAANFAICLQLVGSALLFGRRRL